LYIIISEGYLLVVQGGICMKDDDFDKLNNEAGFSRKNIKYIVFTVLLLIYFLLILILDSTGVISTLVRRILLYGMFGLMFIIYLVLKRKE
jgi:hypothetical protein